MVKHLIFILWGLFALTGCSDNPNRSRNETNESRKDLQESETKAEFDRKKEAYRKALADELVELDRQATELKEKMDRATGEAKTRMREQLDKLRAQHKGLDRQLEKLEETGADRWNDFSRDLDRAVKELKESYEKAKDRFK